METRRGAIVESRHRGHIVEVDLDGSVQRAFGDPDVTVTMRSSAKPFTIVPLIESGAADAFRVTRPELALMAASHSGEDMHVRTLQAVFRRSTLTQTLLACGTAGAPLDTVTAARLARDGEAPSPVRHMCSGHHAASLLLSRHAGWSLEDYWQPDHPSQVAARAALARVLGVRPSSLVTAIDACGIPTYAVKLMDVARAYALLADPGSARDGRANLGPALIRIRDAMLAAPEMVGGSRERLDTVLMKQTSGRVVAKGGAEGLRGLGILPGARGVGTPAAGIALKVEDGDGQGRASHAVTVEALLQVGVLDETIAGRLAAYHRPVALDPRGEVVGESVPGFQLAPISELL